MWLIVHFHFNCSLERPKRSRTPDNLVSVKLIKFNCGAGTFFVIIVSYMVSGPY